VGSIPIARSTAAFVAWHTAPVESLAARSTSIPVQIHDRMSREQVAGVVRAFA
jgi:hypothetical protein